MTKRYGGPGAALGGLLALMLLSLSTLAGTVQAAPQDFEEIMFTDTENHAGPGPHPDSESNDFHLVNGAIKWFSGEAVEYEINDAPSQDAAKAVQRAVATLDGYITNRDFVLVEEAIEMNPCTGAPNSFSWLRTCRWLKTSGDVLMKIVTIEAVHPSSNA